MSDDLETPRFEIALKQLEAIVDELERGAPELSVALARYEQGVRLLAQCHNVLDQAERSVAMLTGVDEAGNPSLTSFKIETSEIIDTPAAAKPRKRKRATAADEDENDASIPF